MFAPTHPAFGLGDSGRVGLTTSFGLGARPLAVPEADRPISADFVHLAIDIRMKQICKEKFATLANREAAAGVLIDSVESDLTRAEVSMRQAERAMRHLLSQQRAQS